MAVLHVFADVVNLADGAGRVLSLHRDVAGLARMACDGTFLAAGYPDSGTVAP